MPFKTDFAMTDYNSSASMQLFRNYCNLEESFFSRSSVMENIHYDIDIVIN